MRKLTRKELTLVAGGSISIGPPEVTNSGQNVGNNSQMRIQGTSTGGVNFFPVQKGIDDVNVSAVPTAIDTSGRSGVTFSL